MNTLIVRLLAVCVVLVLAGCATPAKQESMIPELATKIAVNDRYASALAVGTVSGGKKTNPLWISNISSEDFKSSLLSTLKARGYHSANGPYKLDAKLLAVEQPLFGANFTVKSVVEYVIQDQSGKTVFQKTITAAYTAKFSDSLYGAHRLRLANEGSARNNIKNFLDALDQS